MRSGTYRFDRFLLDPADRQLRRDDVPVEINARYLDALAFWSAMPASWCPRTAFFTMFGAASRSPTRR